MPGLGTILSGFSIIAEPYPRESPAAASNSNRVFPHLPPQAAPAVLRFFDANSGNFPPKIDNKITIANDIMVVVGQPPYAR